MAQDEMIRDWSDLQARYTGRFVPGPFYSPETDMLHVFVAEDPHLGEWLDSRVSIKRSAGTNEVASCHLSSVRSRLLPIVHTLALDDGGDEVTVKSLLLAAIIAAADEGGPAQLNGRGYLQALAPICRAVGSMRADLAG